MWTIHPPRQPEIVPRSAHDTSRLKQLIGTPATLTRGGRQLHRGKPESDTPPRGRSRLAAHPVDRPVARVLLPRGDGAPSLPGLLIGPTGRIGVRIARGGDGEERPDEGKYAVPEHDLR